MRPRILLSLLPLVGATLAHAQLNTWAAKASKPTAVTHTAGVGLNGLLYVVGGTTGGVNTTALETFDPTTNQWATGAAAPVAVSDHAIARSGSKIYVCGGRTTPTGAASNVVNSYDPSIPAWAPRPAMPTARFGACAAFDSSTLFVFGGDAGSGSGGSFTNAVEAFSTVTDTWGPVASMPTPRRGATAAVVGSFIVVVGGEDASGAMATVEAYDIAGDKWTTKASLPAPRTQAGCAVMNGILYVVGGLDANGQNTNSVFLYDLTTNRWLPGVNAPYAFSGGAVGKANGQLTIAGGSGGASSTAVYTPGSVSFVISQANQDNPNSPLGAKFKAYGPPIINAKGHYAYQGTLIADGGAVPSVGILGIWADHDSAPAKLIAQSGTEAPGANKSHFASFSDPAFDNSDNVAFIAKLKPGTGDVAGLNATGIWSDASASGKLELVARLGTQAPDCAFNVKFVAFISLVLPDSGGTAFVAKIAGPNVKPTNNVGLWADDGNGNVRLVARTGDSIPVAGSATKTLALLTIFPAVKAVGGQTRSFNANADFAYRATFTDHTQALVHVVGP